MVCLGLLHLDKGAPLPSGQAQMGMIGGGKFPTGHFQTAHGTRNVAGSGSHARPTRFQA